MSHKRCAKPFTAVAGGALLWLTLAHASAHAENRVALVVGNSNYQFTTPLKNPKNDATDMAASLTQLGFKVISGFDLDKSSMEQLVQKFAIALKTADIGVLFYAGHGLQVDGQNYFVPVNAKLEDETAVDFETVRLDLVQRAMERAAKTNIIFLDACRVNPLAGSLLQGAARSVDIGRGLAKPQSGIGTLISFSTEPGNAASDGEGRNSPYAASLSRRILNRGDDIQGVLVNVRNDVLMETNGKQIPWDHSALRKQVFLVNPPPKGDPELASFRTDFQNATETLLSQGTAGREARRRLVELDDAEEAKTMLRRLAEAEAAMAAPPNKPAAKLFRQLGGVLALSAGDAGKNATLKAYQRAVGLDPSEPQGWERLGALQKQLGSKEAAQSFSRLIEIGEKTDEPIWVAVGRSNLGDIYKVQGKLRQAVTEFERAGATFRERRDLGKRVPNYYGHLGTIYWLLGDFDNAEKNLRTSLELHLTRQNEREAMVDYSTIGRILCDLGELDKASDALDKAFELHDSLVAAARAGRDLVRISDYERPLIYLHRNRACVDLARGDLKRALQSANASLQVATKHADREGIMVAHADIGDVFLARFARDRKAGDLREAKANYDLALRRANDLDSALNIARGKGNMGAVLVAQKKPDGALALINQSLAAFSDIGSRPGIAAQYKNLGDLYAKTDRTKACANWKDARDRYRETKMKLAAQALDGILAAAPCA